MATSPDSTTINRDSLKQGILGLYQSNAKAGGAFDAHQAGTNTMIIGCTAPFGFTQKSRTRDLLREWHMLQRKISRLQF
jgi:hypothetical protein